MERKYNSLKNLANNDYINSFKSIYQSNINYKKFFLDKNMEYLPVSYKCNHYFLHIGIGGFHRSHQAYLIQMYNELNNTGFNIYDDNWGIIGINFHKDIVEKMKKQDNLYTLTMRDNKNINSLVINSIKSIIYIDNINDKILSLSNIRVISLTVTEKGYYMDENRNLDINNKLIKYDIDNFGGIPKTIYGLIGRILEIRRKNNLENLVVLSCDNVSNNGDMLHRCLIQFSKFISDELCDYVKNSVKCPNSMVDRITPQTTNLDKFLIENETKVIDKCPVISEHYYSWIIEDIDLDRYKFPKFNHLESVIFTNDVKKFENMKLLLLNSTHSYIGILGLEKGYQYSYEAMKDTEIRETIIKYLESVKNCLTTDCRMFIKILVDRFSNIYIKDKLERLVEDLGEKIRNTLNYAIHYYYNNDKINVEIFNYLDKVIEFIKNSENEMYKILRDWIINGELKKVYTYFFGEKISNWILSKK